MERGINVILESETPYRVPYTNHVGGGTAMGSGNIRGCGYALIDYKPKENYKGSDIITFNGEKTYFFDDFVVLIKHFRFPWIKGEIIKNDLTTQPCYLTRVNNKIVVSDSIKNVYNELKEKIELKKYNDLDVARAFVMYHPDYEKKYEWGEMIEWHSLSLNSCTDGRKRFTTICNKKNKDLVTPKEFIDLIIEYSPARKLGEEMKKIYNS